MKSIAIVLLAALLWVLGLPPLIARTICALWVLYVVRPPALLLMKLTGNTLQV